VLAAVAVSWIANRTGLPVAALLPRVGIGYALLPGSNVSRTGREGTQPGLCFFDLTDHGQAHLVEPY
jgi:hypothetical protein